MEIQSRKLSNSTTMTYRPQEVKCQICKNSIDISKVKYHTSREEGSPVKIFCGPECSLKYYQEKRNAS